MDKD
jgi:hypothetical protein